MTVPNEAFFCVTFSNCFQSVTVFLFFYICYLIISGGTTTGEGEKYG